MGNGVFPALGECQDKIGRKHILIKLPDETIKRKCIRKDSLLYVAASLHKEYVHLPGFNEQCLRVSSLPNDILKSRVFMYKVESPKTFTAVIDGSGYTFWPEDIKEKK